MAISHLMFIRRFSAALVVFTGLAVTSAEAAESNSNATKPSPPTQVRIRRQVGPPAAGAPSSTADAALTPTGRVNALLPSAAEAAKFAAGIRTAPLTVRDSVVADVAAKTMAAEQTVTGVEKSSGEMNAEGRQQLKEASETAKEKAQVLRQSIQKAGRAGGSEWDGARAQLASDYEAFAAAVSRVDAVNRTTPATR